MQDFDCRGGAISLADLPFLLVACYFVPSHSSWQLLQRDDSGDGQWTTLVDVRRQAFKESND